MRGAALFLILAEGLLLFSLPVQRWTSSLVALLVLAATFLPRMRISKAFLSALLVFTTSFLVADSWRMLDPRLSPFSSLPLGVVGCLFISTLFSLSKNAPKRWIPTWMVGLSLFSVIVLMVLFHVFPAFETYDDLWRVSVSGAWSSEGLLWRLAPPFWPEPPVFPELPLFVAVTLALVFASPLGRELPLDSKQWQWGLRFFLLIVVLFAPIKAAMLCASPSESVDISDTSGDIQRSEPKLSEDAEMHRAIGWRQLGYWPKERDHLLRAGRAFVDANAPAMALPALSLVFRTERDRRSRLRFATALREAGDEFIATQLFAEDQVAKNELLAYEARTVREALHLAKVLHWRGFSNEARARLRPWVDEVLSDPSAFAKEREVLEKVQWNSRDTPLGNLIEFAGELASQADDNERLQAMIQRLRRDPYGLVVGRYLAGLQYYEDFQPEQAVSEWEKAVRSFPGNRKYISKLAGLYAWIGEISIVNQLRQWLVIKGKTSVWRGKQGNKLYLNGDAVWRVELTRGMFEIRLRVSGTPYKEVMPHLTILANGEMIGEGEVSTKTDSHLFTARFFAKEGLNEILVRFDNDDAGEEGDRNLFVHEAMIFPIYYRGVFR